MTVRGCATGRPAGCFREEAESQSHFAGVDCRALGLAHGLSLVRVLGNPTPGMQLHWRLRQTPVKDFQTLSTHPVGRQRCAQLVSRAVICSLKKP